MEIFDQRYLSATNRYYLDYQGDEIDPLVSKMLSRLKVAALNPDVIRQLEAEEELEQELSDYRNMLTELQALKQEKAVLVQEKKELAAEKAALQQA